MEKTLRLLELFAGSRSVGKVAEQEFDMRVFSIDNQALPGIDAVADIGKLACWDIPFVPDIIWASPPCDTYSMAALAVHRDGINPKTEKAVQADELLAHTIWLINEFVSLFPFVKFFIENPRGMMRKMPVMKGIDRRTVTYCSYGYSCMKPTDIWSNHLFNIYNEKGFRPLPLCYNNRRTCLHERSPRGVGNRGVQGQANAYERGKIPEMLVREILKSCL